MISFGVINYGAFLVAAILLNLTPGVDTLYVLGRSVSGGTRVGVVSALGISTGLLVHTLLVTFGLSIVLVSSPWLFWGVKILGACYLVFLGIQALASKKSALTSEALEEKSAAEDRRTEAHAQGASARIKSFGQNYGRYYLQGVITNVANPKAALFFLAFLPQFVDPASSFGPLPFLILGLSFITTSTIWSLILAFGAGQFKRLLDKRPRLSLNVSRGTGILYILLGISVFATPLPE